MSSSDQDTMSESASSPLSYMGSPHRSPCQQVPQLANHFAELTCADLNGIKGDNTYGAGQQGGYNQGNHAAQDSIQDRGQQSAGGNYYGQNYNYDYVIQDTIFIQGMDPSTTEDELCWHFGAIGIIKTDKKTQRPKVRMYKDEATGQPKGEATLTYLDPIAASSAIEWFNEKDFKGAVIKVSLALASEHPGRGWRRSPQWARWAGGDRNNSGGAIRGGGGGQYHQ